MSYAQPPNYVICIGIMALSMMIHGYFITKIIPIDPEFGKRKLIEL